MAQYKGFSTYNRPKHFRITDFELVKQDLINHFNIRKGEKLMNPNYGTIIWDSIFEPLDENLKNLIVQDVKRVISSDPRVSAQNVIVTQFDRGVQIEIDLIYIPSGSVSSLTVQFDQQRMNQLQTL
jgi:phage baseplate assembly protein W